MLDEVHFEIFEILQFLICFSFYLKAVIITTQAMSVNPPELINFDVNRPFLYYILETVEKTILFTGRFASTRV